MSTTEAALDLRHKRKPAALLAALDLTKPLKPNQALPERFARLKKRITKKSVTKADKRHSSDQPDQNKSRK